MEKILERYQDLYFYIKSNLNDNVVLNLEKSEYIDDFEITGTYKKKRLSIRNLENDTLVLDYEGKLEDLEYTLVPILTNFMGEKPLCRYEVADFQTLKRKTYHVEWNDEEKLEEIKSNNIIDNFLIIRDIYIYQKDKNKQLIKK